LREERWGAPVTAQGGPRQQRGQKENRFPKKANFRGLLRRKDANIKIRKRKITKKVRQLFALKKGEKEESRGLLRKRKSRTALP